MPTSASGTQVSTPSLTWRLHAVMADRGFRFASDLHAALVARDVSISPSSIARLVNNAPKQLDLVLLAQLCATLQCTPNELLVPA